jgi:hypothetical protein
MKPAQLAFMRELAKWQHIASPRDLGPQTSQEENSARQFCKRQGWVTFDGHYWRTTDKGRAALRTATLHAAMREGGKNG